MTKIAQTPIGILPRPSIVSTGWVGALVMTFTILFQLDLAGVDVASKLSTNVITVSSTRLLTRIGIGPGTWTGVNRNDATAAIVAWAKSILRKRGTEIEVEATVYTKMDEMVQAIQQERIDAASMLTPELLSLPPEFFPPTVYVAVKGSTYCERYVLLTHQRSGITNLDSIARCRLAVQSGATASMALPWLETKIWPVAPRRIPEFFRTVSTFEGPSKAVLNVFFRQVDVGVVTANAFGVICELNPQVQNELRVLATSPEFVPSVFFFHPLFASALREDLEPAILSLHESVAGRQLLTVFQCDKMVKRPFSVLNSARDLIRDHSGLFQSAESVVEKKTLLSGSIQERRHEP